MAKIRNNLPTPKTTKQYDKLIHSGTKHYQKGEYAQGLSFLTKALEFEGYHPNTLVLMARCLFGLGMKNKAISLMEHALDQNAENPGICESLGNACISFDMNELAAKFFTLYIQLSPNDPTGYNNLATALRENGQVDEAIQILQDIIPIFPEYAILWNSLGAGVSFREGYPAALVFYEEAYRLDPSQVMFSTNLSIAYASLEQYDKAYKFAKKAVQLAPKSAHSHRALAHSSYRIGNFKEGMDALAWHNHPSEPGSVFMPYQIDKWMGEDLKGKTILIGAEQGIGDEILFSSLYPAAIKEAKHVIIGCDKRLVPLFQNSFKEATVLPYTHGQHDAGYNVRLYEDIDPEQIDYMCLYTEFLRFRWQSLADIPDMTDGFLIPPQDKVAYWQKKLTELPHKINIGFCWRSGLKQAKRSMFYADILDWVHVLKTENVNFINIQYGDCTTEINQLLEDHGIVLHNFEELDLKDDFQGTAALIKNLDLVMGPGTSPVAQAATAGTLCWWVDFSQKAWWTFGSDGNTPLFPKNKIFNKPPTMDWKDFLPLFAEDKFIPWVAEKLKEQSA